MQEGIDQLVAGEVTVVQVLTWADKKSRMANVPAERRSAVRLAYVFLSRSLDHALDRKRVFFLVDERARDLDLGHALSRTLALALDLARSPDRAIALSPERSRALTRALALASATTPHVGFDYGLFYAWSYAQFFANEKLDRTDTVWQATMMDFLRLLLGMRELAKEARLTSAIIALAAHPIPPATASSQDWQHYGTALFAILRQRELGREWTFSDEQIRKLNIYFAANELLVQCLKVATVTNRQSILNGVLAPPSLVVAAKPTELQEGKDGALKEKKKRRQLW